MLTATLEMTLFVLLAAILSGPILGAKLRIPGLLGLIFMGLVFGPFGLGWLGRVNLVFDLGAIGILYLMFLAGIGFNLKSFSENRRSALGFGLLSFGFPFALSVWFSLETLGVGILGAALIGSMWASNTLVAYPDVRAAGLDDTRAVRDAVSGGVVADVLSLLILAAATAHTAIEVIGSDEAPAQTPPTVPLWISLPLLALFTLWLLPRLGRWFFVRIGRTRVQRVLFALAAMTAGATLAVIGGISGIIGAFLAGIGLNTLVPRNSELMERIDFLGSTIFVPAFLVSIGLRIDPVAFFDGSTIQLGIAFTGLVVVGKAVAVLVAGLFFRYSFAEAGLITSLSIGQAASTLAIGQVGLALGLFGEQVVNASILAIVFTALLTSFGTQFFIRRHPAPEPSAVVIGDRVLFDAGEDAGDLAPMIAFAGRIARGDDGIAVPFVVAGPGRKEHAQARIREAESVGTEAGYDTTGVVRISDGFTEGTLALTVESDASMVVLAWTGPRPGTDYLFGSDLYGVGSASPVPVAAARLTGPWDRVIAIPGNGEIPWNSDDARLALTVAARVIGRNASVPLLVIADNREMVEAHSEARLDYEFIEARLPGDALLDVITPTDLVVAPSYLLPEMSLPRRIRIAQRLAGHNIAIVAGPGRLAVPRATSHALEGILGPQV